MPATASCACVRRWGHRTSQDARPCDRPLCHDMLRRLLATRDTSFLEGRRATAAAVDLVPCQHPAHALSSRCQLLAADARALCHCDAHREAALRDVGPGFYPPVRAAPEERRIPDGSLHPQVQEIPVHQRRSDLQHQYGHGTLRLPVAGRPLPLSCDHHHENAHISRGVSHCRRLGCWLPNSFRQVQRGLRRVDGPRGRSAPNGENALRRVRRPVGSSHEPALWGGLGEG
mmetsp:Transcript_49728/g.146668  ORF Transcript_49728/g.146668 Transcript_49728/m.146668 type:complete len:230 (-) Transcript_49728:668-1357(-)